MLNARKNISSGTIWEKTVGYSRAVRIGSTIEVAGTTAVDENGQVVGQDDAYAQTRFILSKIEQALTQAGASLQDVVKTRMFVTDIPHWEEIGRAHGEVFGEIRPAATMVEVKALIRPELLVEIEVTAVSHPAAPREPEWGYPLGFWSAVLTTLGGIVYFLVLLAAALTGKFTFPPSASIQLFGGVSSLLFCPVLVVLMACLHSITSPKKKAWSQAALGFTLLFALAVSINRFSQLGVVRQSLAAGGDPGISWFLAYGDRSILLGLEFLGWGWFLGLAALFAAPIFSIGKLQLWLRWLLVLYGILGLVSAIAFLLASPLSAIGFAAWGLVLFIITGLLAIYFRQEKPA
jgi:enamine deaminase RidA (YjgF/YER057c/UK114 family)